MTKENYKLAAENVQVCYKFVAMEHNKVSNKDCTYLNSLKS